MINIEINRENGRTQVITKGHSGYDVCGKDIVCAGVSTIVQTYAYECIDQSGCDAYIVGDGFLEIITKDTADNEVRLSMLKTAIEGIMQEFSEYVSLKETNKI